MIQAMTRRAAPCSPVRRANVKVVKCPQRYRRNQLPQPRFVWYAKRRRSISSLLTNLNLDTSACRFVACFFIGLCLVVEVAARVLGRNWDMKGCRFLLSPPSGIFQRPDAWPIGRALPFLV